VEAFSAGLFDSVTTSPRSCAISEAATNFVRISSSDYPLQAVILSKQRQKVIHIVVTPMWRLIEAVSRVARRVYDLHG